MAFNRELSQFAAYLSLDAAANYIGITTANTTNVGIGKTNPTSKLEVVGDAKVTGVVTATTFVGALTGNASSATALQNARDFQVTGDAASTAISFDGTANVGLAVTLANTGVVAGSYGSSTTIPTFTVDSKGRLTAAGTASVGAALTVSGNSGTETINFLNETLSIVGAAGSVSTSAASNTITVDLVNTAVTPGSYGSSTAIPTFTVDAKGRLTAAGTAAIGAAVTVAGDSGTETINFLNETLTISGGTNLTSSAAANTVTINLDDNISLTSVVASGVVTAAQFKTGATGSAIGINTNTISGPATITLDPAGVGDNTGTVVIAGNLQVDGTTTTINSTTVTVDDKNVVLADGAINDAAADGGGITVTSGDGNKTFQFENTGKNFGSSENMNLASGKVYKINNVEVLSGTTLGANVVNSSLTSVGTLTNLNVGNVNSTGVGTFAVGAVIDGVQIGINGANVIDTVSGNLTLNSAGGTTIIDDLVNIQNNLTVSGNVTIGGTTVTLTGQDVFITNKDIVLGYTTATSPNDTSANHAGVAIASTEGTPLVNFDVSGINTLPSTYKQMMWFKNGTLGFSTDAFAFNYGVAIGTTNMASGMRLAVGTGITMSDTAIKATNFYGTLSGSVSGNAATATALQTARNFQVTGDAASTAIAFDGTANVGLAVTLANTGVTAGSYGSSTQIPTFTVDSKGRLTAAGTASVGTALTVAGDSGSENINLLNETLTISGGTNLTSSAAANTVTINLDDNISLTSVVASGVVTAAQFKTGATGSAIGINTNTISGPSQITIDPAGVGDNTGLVVIKGDLQIDGTTTTVNSTTVTVDDKNIVLASGAVNDAAADGGGITVESGDGNKTWNWVDSTDSWTSSEHINLASGKVYKVNGTEVLSGSQLTIPNISSSGMTTVTNLTIGGYVSVGSTTGAMNQVLASVGTGVTWKSIADVLPQARTTQTNTATAGQTAFTFTYNVNYLDVFVNGVKLASSEYVATNGSNITLNEGAFAGDVVEFVSYSTVGAGSGTVNSLNDLSDVTLASNTAGNLLAYNGTEWVNTSNLNVGIITCTSVTASGDIAAANFNSTSDVNLKENIRPIENASELVSKLEGVHFTWKESGAETCGVIAQQIEEHLPQLVHTGEDHKSVNYNGLVGVLLAAVKEQGAQIAALQAEIEELKK